MEQITEVAPSDQPQAGAKAAAPASPAAAAWNLAGMLATPLRWVTGWLFFSAFWRRVVLVPAKMDPTSPLWNGRKINDFLPHSIGIGGMLEWLVTHPSILQVFLIAFTAVEAVAGLALMLGLATRLTSIVTAVLSFSILLGAGWIGTTCLDEWQIGVAGVAGSLTLLLAGAGPWSLDRLWTTRWPQLAARPWARLAATEPFGYTLSGRVVARSALALSVAAMLVTLGTNQILAGGVWGPLHNDSKAPHLVLSQAHLAADGSLSVRIYRDGGPDTYGAFVVAATVEDSSGARVVRFTARDLGSLPATAVHNFYVKKVKSSGQSLLVPLAAKADVQMKPAVQAALPTGRYLLRLTDISGASWSTATTVG